LQYAEIVMAQNPNILPGNNDREKLEALCERNYKAQAVWFLNGYWEQFAKDEAEKIWAYKHKYDQLDLEKKESGCGLDELNAHRFLEAFGETMTVTDLRDQLRAQGAITTRPKLVPLTHYLAIRYKIDWHVLVNSAQGDNSAEIAEAQKKLEEVQAAFRESEQRASEARTALNEAQNRENAARIAQQEAKEREAEAHRAKELSIAREADSKAAQKELEAAFAVVKAEEDAYNGKTEDLKRRSEEGGLVSRNKAKNELAQHLGEDPLPLRRAKISAEAAVKRAEKATAAAAEARAAAEKAASEASAARAAAEEASRKATAARAAAEEATRRAEEALEEAQRQLKEAEAFLAEVKAKPGCAHGAIWWIERELHEQRKYLPTAKGGIARK